MQTGPIRMKHKPASQANSSDSENSGHLKPVQETLHNWTIHWNLHLRFGFPAILGLLA